MKKTNVGSHLYIQLVYIGLYTFETFLRHKMFFKEEGYKISKNFLMTERWGLKEFKNYDAAWRKKKMQISL